MVLFKQIKGHNSAYLVGNDGTIFNQKTKKFLKTVKNERGYLHVTLCYGEKRDYLVHRLVAQAFLENPNDLPEMNHKDEDKENNHVDNLEWCTKQYNTTYGERTKSRNTPVIQRDKDGALVKCWDSMKDAGEALNLKYQGISRVCRHKRKTCGGFVWEYANDSE